MFERNGCRCLLIEHSSLAFQKLVLKGPKPTFENLACCSFDGLFEIEVEDLGLMSMTSYSRLNDSEIEELRKRAKQFVNFEPCFDKQTAVPLATLLEKYSLPGIGLLSLDVEGFELQILKGIDFRKFRIEFICLEVMKANQHNELQIAKFLETYGYEGSTVNDRKYTKDILYSLK